METISFQQVPELFDRVGQMFADRKDELCEMDARLGDGDLGLTMSKGFGALPGLMREEAPSVAGDVGKLLVKAGMKMSSLVPSTMGFLMSAGIMEGGKALKGKTEVDGVALAGYLAGFAAGVQKRGKCDEGQRTIYDAVKPAADAATAYVEKSQNASLLSVISAAEVAAKAGVEKTKTMVPVFGKAAVHAAQSAGLADQGATAGFYMIHAMYQYLFE